ncbi:MAG: efflux RND transporter periplasmic adaptor subunit, partial [Verrucomicrobiota bacterium]
MLAAGCRPAPARPPAADAPVPVTTAPVEEIALDRSLPVVGTLFARDEATIAAEVEGRVERTFVEFGDRVSEGQELALIDTASYEALARQARARLAQARATATNAAQQGLREEALRRTGIAATADSDQARAAAEAAAAAAAAAEAALRVAELNVERSRVRAPFEAAVAERIATKGDFVAVGKPMFRLVNDAVLKYIVQAPESYAHQIRRDQAVEFSVDALPGERFAGRVFLISPQVNVSTRSFALGALVTNTARRLKASTFARGEIILERAVRTRVVPLESIVTVAGLSRVFVIENDTARSVDVQLGRVLDRRQELLAPALPAGTVLALTGQTRLGDGSRVTLRAR